MQTIAELIETADKSRNDYGVLQYLENKSPTNDFIELNDDDIVVLGDFMLVNGEMRKMLSSGFKVSFWKRDKYPVPRYVRCTRVVPVMSSKYPTMFQGSA